MRHTLENVVFWKYCPDLHYHSLGRHLFTESYRQLNALLKLDSMIKFWSEGSGIQTDFLRQSSCLAQLLPFTQQPVMLFHTVQRTGID